MKVNFEICYEGIRAVIINDLGLGGVTITNSAEGVVELLYATKVLDQDKRLFYRDTDGNLDGILHADGAFLDFRPLDQITRKIVECTFGEYVNYHTYGESGIFSYVIPLLHGQGQISYGTERNVERHWIYNTLAEAVDAFESWIDPELEPEGWSQRMRG